MDLLKLAPALAPSRLFWREGRCWVEWLPVAGLRFTDPFLVQTFQRRMRQPFGQLCRLQAPIEELLPLEGLPVGALIFHLSRCGSTLITQMLAAVDENVVLSEPEVLDMIFERGPVDPGWLRGLVAALGQRRRGIEQRVFVKLAPWSIFHLPEFARAFANVPKLFVYRDPLEVMVSNLSSRPMRAAPGMLDPRHVGLTYPESVEMPEDEYLARLLAAICESALAHASELRLVHYRELPGIVPRLFGADERMTPVTRRHAKHPSHPFAPDSEEKRRSATPALRALVEKWLSGPYQRLEAARANQPESGPAANR